MMTATPIDDDRVVLSRGCLVELLTTAHELAEAVETEGSMAATIATKLRLLLDAEAEVPDWLDRDEPGASERFEQVEPLAEILGPRFRAVRIPGRGIDQDFLLVDVGRSSTRVRAVASAIGEATVDRLLRSLNADRGASYDATPDEEPF